MGEEILSSDQSRIIEEAKFTYSLRKSFEKQRKTIEDQWEKQVKALEEHGKQLVKYNNEKESKCIQNKKKFMQILFIKEWKKFKI